MWLPGLVANDNPKIALQHFPELVLSEDADPELRRLFQFAPRFLARQEVARLLAHAAADLAAARPDQFTDFLAWLTERSSNDPRPVFETGRRTFRFWFGFETQSGLLQFLDHNLVVWLAKEFVNALADDFANVWNLLQLFD